MFPKIAFAVLSIPLGIVLLPAQAKELTLGFNGIVDPASNINGNVDKIFARVTGNTNVTTTHYDKKDNVIRITQASGLNYLGARTFEAEIRKNDEALRDSLNARINWGKQQAEKGLEQSEQTLKGPAPEQLRMEAEAKAAKDLAGIQQQLDAELKKLQDHMNNVMPKLQYNLEENLQKSVEATEKQLPGIIEAAKKQPPPVK